jgi:hypothetical protein
MGRRQEMEHGDLSTRLAERHSVMPLQLSECFLVHVFQKSTIWRDEHKGESGFPDLVEQCEQHGRGV